MREGATEEMYAHVSSYRGAGAYTEQERLAIEYAERFALDHLSLDGAFFERLRAHFTDEEIFDLSVCVATFLALGRLTKVLRLDQEGDATP